MERREYERMTLAQMKTHEWVTTRPMRNGNLEIPAGLRVKITGKFKGLSLTGEPCACCGVAVRISKVQPGGVRMVTEEDS